jgi:exodeoxyribonuclease-3
LFKLTSLNLNGIRSAARKGLENWLVRHAPDCICVQELKAQMADIEGQLDAFGGLRGYFNPAEKKGYSGVGLYTRHEPSAVIRGYGSSEFDGEGRYLEARFDTPTRKFSIVSCYFPSGTSGDIRQAAKYRFLHEIEAVLQRLKAEREFILCGDVNIAHHEIDLKNWRGNQKNSGFLPDERAWVSKITGDVGLIDVYRTLHPDTTGEAYTWWSNRGQAWTNNVGWRIDYHLATPATANLALDAAIYKDERFSDHAPLTIDYQMKL